MMQRTPLKTGAGCKKHPGRSIRVPVSMTRLAVGVGVGVGVGVCVTTYKCVRDSRGMTNKCVRECV